MNAFVEKYFQWTRERVTDQDILDFSPGDPGYLNYVKLWTEIRRSGKMPLETEFDLSEVMGLIWGPDRRPDAGRYRSYRQFVQAVGIGLLCRGEPSDKVHPPNYLAAGILLDSDRRDRKLTGMLREIFPATREILALRGDREEDFPFFTLAEMIVAHWRQDHGALERAATQLIADEAFVRGGWPEQPEFLFGLTFHNHYLRQWRELAAEIKNPRGHEDTELVLQALAG